MGVKFLKKGDPQPPPLEAGKLRLYSNVYCPFAERPRLVLAVKGVPFETTEINLRNKPEWYGSVHPQTKVPALEMGGGEVVVESLDISDNLDRKFPEPPLWSADQEKNLRHKQLLEQFDKVRPDYIKLLGPNASRDVEDVVPSIATAIQPFENELAKTGSKYFGGAKPGMLDYMIWPWAERLEGLRTLHPDVKLPQQNFPRLSQEESGYSSTYPDKRSQEGREVEELRATIENLQRRIECLESERHMYEDRESANLKEQLMNLSAERDNLIAQLNSAKAEAEALQQEKASLSLEADAIRQEMGQLQGEHLAALDYIKSLEESTAECTMLKEENKRFEDKLQQSTRDQAKLHHEVHRLQCIIRDVEDDRKRTLNQLERLSYAAEWAKVLQKVH